MSIQNTYEAKKASDNIASFIGELIDATETRKIQWDCLNSLSKNYNILALFQDKTVMKYQLTIESSKICSVIFTVDNNIGYNLEVEFSDKKGILIELPLNDEHKKHLEVLKDAIADQLELSSIIKINSQLPAVTQSLSGL